MSGFLQDLRYSLRRLLKSPGFLAMAVGSLALGIGATSAIFSMVNGILLRPLPVKDADRLVRFSTKYQKIPYYLQFSYLNYKDLLERSRTIEDAAAWEPAMPGLATDTFAVKAAGMAVTSNYFEFLGIQPEAGRFFTRHDDDAEGSRAEVVLGNSFWQSRFGADPTVVGTTVRFNNNPFEVVGVVPEEFRGTETLIDPEFFVPISMLELVGAGGREDRSNTNFRVLGRLQEGVSAEQAQAEIDLLAAALIDEHPDQLQGMKLHVIPELKARPEPSIHQVMPVIATLFLGMVGLVLLIACSNIANLVLERGLARRKEISVRAALGATRSRLARQLITENMLVAVLGGTVGLGVAAAASAALERIRPPTDLPIVFDYSFDVRVFLFIAAATILTGLLFGLLPAMRASKPDLHKEMKEGGRGSSEGKAAKRARSALVISEFALASVLLIVAGLFLRSLSHAEQIYLGFEPEQTLLATVSPRSAGYDREKSIDFLERLLERTERLPGVRSVATASTIPFGYSTDGMSLFPEGRPPGSNERMDSALISAVSNDYFQTAGTPLLQGRGFDSRDHAGAPKAAVVNEKLAEMFWPGENPLGKRMANRPGGDWYEVVGVVPTGRYQLLSEDETPFVFLPWAQRPRSEMTFLVRTTGPPEALAHAFRELVRETDAAVPVSSVFPFDDFVYQGKGLMPVRFGAVLMTAFAALGLTLAAIGVFGALSYFVTRRTTEIGIRMVLGANRASLVRMIFGGGTKLAVVGTVLGLAGALAASPLVGSLLLGVTATDPLTYAGVALFLAAVTLIACYLPARRATGLDPMKALRHE